MEGKIFEEEKWSIKDQKISFRHKEALSMINRGKVLDLGCGDGLFLSELKNKGIIGIGLDFSEEAIKKCKEKKVEAKLHDLTSPLPYNNNSFDYVVALDVLEHLYRPERLLSEMIRISGNYIIIGVPNFNSLAARLQMLFGFVPENNRPNKGHIYWFNLSILKMMIKQNNLGLVDIRTSAFRYPGFKFLARLLPSLFALSFVVKVKKSL